MSRKAFTLRSCMHEQSTEASSVLRLYDEPLSRYTTLKIGGPAEVFSVPKTQEQLISEVDYCNAQNIPWRILGNGSNLLVRDRGVNGFVIYNKYALSNLHLIETHSSSSTIEVGSSVILPKLVKFCVDNALEGMEFLSSVPGTVGGGLYMNAGRGRSYNQAISDKVESVKIYDGKEVRDIDFHDCKFSYRQSIFSFHKNWVILSARFKLRAQDSDVGRKKIAERMRFVRRTQERSYPSAGSIFSKASGKALRLLKGFRYGDAQLAGNWISNVGDASAKDVLMVIKVATLLQYLALTRPKLEIEIW